MKYNFGVLLLITIALCGCKDKLNPSVRTESKTPIKDSLTLELQNLSKGYFDGMGVAIVDETGVLYQNGIGLSDVETNSDYTINTIQPIASVSKTLIGISLLKAQEQGLLQLDDPVNKYLPFQVSNPNYPELPITIRQLATHTSTIIDTEVYMNTSYVLKDEIKRDSSKTNSYPQNFNPPSAKIPLSQYLENYLSPNGMWYNSNSFLNQMPGHRFEYSNVGATLAAYIIERVSHQSYAQFTDLHILKPLNMTQTGWDYNSVNYETVSTLYSSPKTSIPHYSLITYPDGGLLTNVSDLGKYLTELIKGYSGKGTLLSKESYNILFETQLNAEHFTERDANHPYDDEYNSGIFMGFSALGNIGHTGGDPGVSTLLFFNSEDKIGRLLLVNTNIENQDGVNAYFNIFNTLGEYSELLK
ncbi:MAG: hypothetical protein BM564_01745 [Bacteroidetes bacterium MedPE-SWsnd-G2]|nr:MAG: hypothetical protein BM564_01745 [Bacteroidetes bacterium MedPE-SWsnd-G2]